MTRIEAADPQHPDALALLREAALEARALYRAAGFTAMPPIGPYVGDPVSRCFEKELAS